MTKYLFGLLLLDLLLDFLGSISGNLEGGEVIVQQLFLRGYP